MATGMQIGQEMLTLEDQHRAMYFSLEMVPSVGPAENNPQLLSLQLKQSTLLRLFILFSLVHALCLYFFHSSIFSLSIMVLRKFKFTRPRLVSLLF